jgi:hypothetical protein
MPVTGESMQMKNHGLPGGVTIPESAARAIPAVGLQRSTAAKQEKLRAASKKQEGSIRSLAPQSPDPLGKLARMLYMCAGVAGWDVHKASGLPRQAYEIKAYWGIVQR